MTHSPRRPGGGSFPVARTYVGDVDGDDDGDDDDGDDADDDGDDADEDDADDDDDDDGGHQRRIHFGLRTQMMHWCSCES